MYNLIIIIKFKGMCFERTSEIEKKNCISHLKKNNIKVLNSIFKMIYK